MWMFVFAAAWATEPTADEPSADEPSADGALLDALLRLADPTTAREAALLMGTLDDPRVVGPLLAAAKVRDTVVAVAAVSSLGRWPEATDHLAAWVSDEDVGLAVRRAAVDALAVSHRPEALAALEAALVEGPGREIRVHILAALATHFPESGVKVRHSREAAPWLALGWGWGFGYGFGALGRSGDGLAGLGAVTGGVGGGTAGFVYGATVPQDAGRAAFTATTGIVGTVSGVLVGTGIDPHDADVSWGAGAVGEAIGYTVGIALPYAMVRTPADSTEAVLPALAVATLAGAIADDADDLNLVPEDRTEAPLLAAGIGLAGGYALGTALAPVWDVQGNDVPVAGLLGAFGITTGVLVADVPIADPSVALGLGGLGLAAGYAAAPYVDFREDVLLGATGGWLLGSVAGVGIEGTAFGFDDAPQWGPALGGAAGLGIGGALAHLNPNGVDSGDVMLATLVGAFGTWQAIGWAADQEAEGADVGPFVLAPALATAAAGAVSPYVDVSAEASVTATSIGLWGAYVGTSLDVLAFESNSVLRAALIGSDVGAAVGTGALALGARPADLLVGDLGGLVGGSSAALLAALGAPSEEIIVVASLGGSAIGFGGAVAFVRLVGAPGGNQSLRIAPRGSVSLLPAVIRGKEDAATGARLVWVGW
jgi:hypothetical protein